MIFNAKDRLLNQVTPNLPNMGATVASYFQNLVIGLLTKSIVNNRVQEVTTNYETKGTIQPLTQEELAIKPEGERSWKWQMLHCQPSLSLKTDDIALIKGIRYRVMGRKGYTDYGYVRYELVEDYETEIPEATP